MKQRNNCCRCSCAVGKFHYLAFSLLLVFAPLQVQAWVVSPFVPTAPITVGKRGAPQQQQYTFRKRTSAAAAAATKDRTVTTTTTALNLFFKKALDTAAAPSPPKRSVVPESVEQQWRQGIVNFPYQFPVAFKQQQVDNINKNNILTIRLMQWKDLPAIIEMCVREYGNLYTTTDESSLLSSFHSNQKKWFDAEQASLGAYVALSMILKLLLDYSFASPNNNKNSKKAAQRLPKDHVILVATIHNNDSSSRNSNNNKNIEQLVGMIEVSRQPPMPERNPPAIPIPLFLKEAYCRLVLDNGESINSSSSSGRQRSAVTATTESWITNLLIVPEYRGRGWAKALVMACEGVARAWKTRAIHLHCDATYQVPQKLYRSLDYEPGGSSSSSSSRNKKKDNDFSWMSPYDHCQSSIYFIEGFPLLYMCKTLL